jgi:hypothetical protein
VAAQNVANVLVWVRFPPSAPFRALVAETVHADGCNPSYVGAIPTRRSNIMAKTKTKKLVIMGCFWCPKCKREQSPYTGDSFDMVDEDAFCTGVTPRRILTASSRPWTLEKELKGFPEWCPL